MWNFFKGIATGGIDFAKTWLVGKKEEAAMELQIKQEGMRSEQQLRLLKATR